MRASLLVPGITVTGVHAGTWGRVPAVPPGAAEALGLDIDRGVPVAISPSLRTSALRDPARADEFQHAGVIRFQPEPPYLRLLRAPEERIWQDDPLEHSA